jgi:RimJ/RimL family protein N-acetyltransferase
LAVTKPIRGQGFSLRCVEARDAGEIVLLRTSDCLRNQHLNEISSDVADQERYIAAQRSRPFDFYFAVVSIKGDRSEGFVGLYNVDTSARTAEWGRWILREGSLASVESTSLVMDFGFDCLGMDTVYCHTLTANIRVLANHDSFGLRRAGSVMLSHNGAQTEGVRHEMTRERWPETRHAIAPIISRVARRVIA